MLLLRNKKNYPRIITKYSSLTIPGSNCASGQSDQSLQGTLDSQGSKESSGIAVKSLSSLCIYVGRLKSLLDAHASYRRCCAPAHKAINIE